MAERSRTRLLSGRSGVRNPVCAKPFRVRSPGSAHSIIRNGVIPIAILVQVSGGTIPALAHQASTKMAKASCARKATIVSRKLKRMPPIRGCHAAIPIGASEPVQRQIGIDEMMDQLSHDATAQREAELLAIIDRLRGENAAKAKATSEAKAAHNKAEKAKAAKELKAEREKVNKRTYRAKKRASMMHTMADGTVVDTFKVQETDRRAVQRLAKKTKDADRESEAERVRATMGLG